MAEQDLKTLEIQLKNGLVEVSLLPEIAPKHVERIINLSEAGHYDNVAFHRVIDGFMAQTGDVEFGNVKIGWNKARAGTGGSNEPNLPAEFSKLSFDRGALGMARAQDPDSANSQFFIMFEDGHFLNGQYTLFGNVTKGMDLVDKITRGDQDDNGSVDEPDIMIKVKVK
ncbi:MAG: peptidylprolyl isomerase [Paracoccaceae bacterium]|nr:peptidylprolyl isomerase [Paracoccaceae bacterium]